MKEKLTCESGIKPNLINKEGFDREISMCKKLNKKNESKCCWGECKCCGVIPLLFRLHKGEFLEKPEEIERVKGELFDK